MNQILNNVHCGDCLEVLKTFPDESVDIIVTSPPYWGQRMSMGVGVEEDPREYLRKLIDRFVEMKRILKQKGIMWINIGDAYNTPINWSQKDHVYSSLGPDGKGFDENNVAYTKPRHKRKAFVDPDAPWLKYGNLLAIPQRLIVGLCDAGWYYRGEVIWSKLNPMPEGRCRRPHRAHEGVYLFAKNEQHTFAVSPRIKSVWEFSNENADEIKHASRFPSALPRQCIAAYDQIGADVVVLDPYSGSGTTCFAALGMGCSCIGIEIDPVLVRATNQIISKRLGKECS